VPQSGQGSEAGEQEVRELTQLLGFFNDPSIVEELDSNEFGQQSASVNLDRLVQEEAEGFGAVVDEEVGAWSHESAPLDEPQPSVPGGDWSDEYDDGFTFDEHFIAEAVGKYPDAVFLQPPDFFHLYFFHR
jgi:hypothetical protein